MGQSVARRMRALYFEKTGGLEQLQVASRPWPELAPGDALIRVHAAAINPSDVKNVLGRFSLTTLPRVPGRDFSGAVLKGPPDLVGREVFGSAPGLGFTRDGSHAEVLAVPADCLALKPSLISFEQAAALGVPYLTAWQSLFAAGGLKEGETLLILGAGGAVGSAAAHLAKTKRARVLGTATQASGLERVKPLPVDHWIALDQEDLVEKVMALTEGRGVDLVLDAVGAPLFERGLKCLAQRGRQVSIASTASPRVEFHLVDFYHRESTLKGVDSLKLSFKETGDILRELARLVEREKVPPPAVTAVALEEAPAAYARIAEGAHREKTVIRF
ncbi:MAG TPA: zinc-binding alcohol dehydrogenase family protein [bacterium]|nr:zinc-binding alcohol dehydrogenase family protein [bacterium]